MLHFSSSVSVFRNPVWCDIAWNTVWHTTPHCIQISELCVCSSGFSRIHITPNSLPFQWAVFPVPVSYIKSFCWLMDGTYLPTHVVWGPGTIPASCIKSLTNTSPKSRCNNFEAHMARMIKLFRMVRSRKWNNGFYGLSVNGLGTSCGHFYPHTPHNYTISFCASPWSSQKISSAGGWSIFVSMFQFCPSFQTTVIKIPLTLYVTLLQFHCLSKLVLLDPV